MDLLEHQKEGVEFLLKQKSGGLFYEMRLGKSRTLLETLHQLKSKHKIFPVLIVAPLSVVPVWPAEIKKFNYDFSCVEVTGSRANRLELLNQKKDIYIINYEGVRILHKDLIKMGFKTIALDESHRGKSIKAQVTRCILDLGYNADYRFILTGTPITKSPEDIWSQIQFIKPGFLGNFYAFRSRYIEFRKVTVRANGGLKEIQIPHRFKNLKELEQKLSLITLRKTQAECFDLPEKSYNVINCHMEGDQLKKYYEMKHCLQIELNNRTLTVKNALTQITKMQQICHGFIYDESSNPVWLKNNVKIKVLTDLLETILEPKKDLYNPDKEIPQEKVVLFCNYKADLELLQSKLIEHEFNYVLYSGENRQNAIDVFNESKDPIVFLTTIEIGKEGINLSAASQMIYYGRNYNYASRYQSEARIQSIINRRNLVYYDLVCPNTIDEKVLTVLKMKGDLADKILGDSIRLAELECEESNG